MTKEDTEGSCLVQSLGTVQYSGRIYRGFVGSVFTTVYLYLEVTVPSAIDNEFV